MLRFTNTVHKITKVQQENYRELREVISPSSFNLYPSSLHICYTLADSEVYLGDGFAFGKLSDEYGGYWTVNSMRGLGNKDFDLIIDFINNSGSKISEFRNVTQSLALNLSDSYKYNAFEEDSGLHQYTYKIYDFITLNGSGYSKVRREITKFLNLYSSQIKIKEVTKFECNTKKLSSYRKLFNGWQGFGTNGSTNSEDEEYTFNNFLELQNYDMFSVPLIIEVWYGNVLVALSVNDIVSKHYGVNYFHFSNLNLSGISYYLFYITCKLLNNYGVEILNFQEDCGIQGLRDFKTRLRPHKIEKQYSIKII